MPERLQSAGAAPAGFNQEFNKGFLAISAKARLSQKADVWQKKRMSSSVRNNKLNP